MIRLTDEQRRLFAEWCLEEIKGLTSIESRAGLISKAIDRNFMMQEVSALKGVELRLMRSTRKPSDVSKATATDSGSTTRR